MPRAGVAWDPTGSGRLVGPRGLRHLLRPVPERRRALRRRWRSARRPGRSSSSSAAPASTSRIRILGRPAPAPETFMRPSTVFALDPEAKPPSVQNWNVERSALVPGSIRRRGALRRREGQQPAAQRRSESRGLWTRRHGAERRPPAHLRQLPGRRQRLRRSRPSRCCRASRDRATRPAQASISRRFGGAVGFNVSYWYSQSFDHLSAMNLSGAAAQAACRRERPRAEPVRSRRRVGAVAVRRAAPLRRQRELDAADVDERAGRGAGRVRRTGS